MKKVVLLVMVVVSFAQAQEAYFQGPFFDRWYSPLELSQLAALDVTLAIREAVAGIGPAAVPAKSFTFTFVSRQAITTETHDLIEGIFSPLYAGDTSAFRDWLETYYSQKALADEMELYFAQDYYTAVAPDFQGFDTKDFADALTMFLTMSYLVYNHLDSTPPQDDLALRDQVRSALAKSKRYASLSDAEKQQGSVLLLFFTSYIVGEYNRAVSDDKCEASASGKYLCPVEIAIKLVSTFAQGVAQIFGFRVDDFVMNERGLEQNH
jgi:hypothetical protein